MIDQIDQFFSIIKTLGDFFRPCFGPHGLDKMIFDRFNNDLILTNDGQTMLKNLKELMNPQASKQIINWGNTISTENGDGIKTFYILLGDIIHQAHELLKEGIPIALILQGISLIKTTWREFSQSNDFHYSETPIDPASNQNFYRSNLSSLISGKISKENEEHLIAIVLDLINRLKPWINQPNFRWETAISLEFLPGTIIKDTQLMDGILISKDPVIESQLQSRGLINPRILLVRQKLYYEQPQTKDQNKENDHVQMEIQLKSPEERQQFELWWQNQIHSWFSYIEPYHPDVIITEKGIDRDFEQVCNSHNIYLIRRAKSEEFMTLARYLGVDPIDDLKDISEESIGTAGELVQRKIGKDLHSIIRNRTISDAVLTNTNRFPTIGTVIIGGTFWSVCQEIERYFKKMMKTAIALTRSPLFFYGGGNTELNFYFRLHEQTVKIPTKIAYVVDKLASSFLEIPRLLITNAGLDSTFLLTEMQKQYKSGEKAIGLNSSTNQIESMKIAEIYDVYWVKNHIVNLVLEIVTQIIRIDRIISSKNKRSKA